MNTGLSLQTSQKFLIQKMLQKTLKICVIMPAFFDPGNGGENMRFVQKISAQKNLEKSTGFLSIFDVVNCNNEGKPVKPQLSKNHEKLVLSSHFF